MDINCDNEQAVDEVEELLTRHRLRFQAGKRYLGMTSHRVKVSDVVPEDVAEEIRAIAGAHILDEKA